jgi:RNase adaptor protein for sRNA GlmZ degradation
MPQEELLGEGYRGAASRELDIVSHGHANGPYRASYTPTRLLRFSVRDIPNPPAQLRRTHTGLSSRLRKEVLASTAARARLHDMTEHVTDAMASLENGGGDHASSPTKDGPISTETRLLVVITCEEGKHRSVSFVETLAKEVKRRGWVISIVHRDLYSTATGADNMNPSIGSPSTKKQRERGRDDARAARRRQVTIEYD